MSCSATRSYRTVAASRTEVFASGDEDKSPTHSGRSVSHRPRCVPLRSTLPTCSVDGMQHRRCCLRSLLVALAWLTPTSCGKGFGTSVDGCHLRAECRDARLTKGRSSGWHSTCRMRRIHYLRGGSVTPRCGAVFVLTPLGASYYDQGERCPRPSGNRRRRHHQKGKNDD
jgi:hypothetical protein